MTKLIKANLLKPGDLVIGWQKQNIYNIGLVLKLQISNKYTNVTAYRPSVGVFRWCSMNNSDICVLNVRK